MGGENNPHLPLLNDLESTIDTLFAIYQKQGLSIQQVEEDLKWKVQNNEIEEDRAIHQQILNLIDSRDLNLV